MGDHGIESGDEQSGRQSVSHRRFRSDHRERQHVVDRLPAAGIDNVPQASSLVVEKLFATAAGRQSGSAQRQATNPASRLCGMLQTNSPAITTGQQTAVSAVNQKVLDSGGLQILGEQIERVPLADGSQVDRHSRTLECDRAGFGIECDILPTYPLLGCRQLGFGGAFATAIGKPPSVNERPGRHIKSTRRCPPSLLGSLQNLTQHAANHDGTVCRLAVDAGEFTRWIINGQAVFNICQPV